MSLLIGINSAKFRTVTITKNSNNLQYLSDKTNKKLKQ